MNQEWTQEDQKWAKEVLTCRQIVAEIARFGVNEEQKLKIIELLALELENRDASVEIARISKSANEAKQKNTNSGRILT